jgi:hypothetical protein
MARCKNLSFARYDPSRALVARAAHARVDEALKNQLEAEMGYDPGLGYLLVVALFFSKPAIILILFAVGAAGAPRYKAVIPFAAYLVFTSLFYVASYRHGEAIDWAYIKTVEISTIVLAILAYCLGASLRYLANRYIHRKREHPRWMRDLESKKVSR